MPSKIRYLAGLILLLFVLFVLFAEPLAPFREQFRPKPTVGYESLPIYSENDNIPFYQPITPSPFTEINVFKDIVAWNNYLYDIPIFLSDNTILIAGYIEDEKSNYQGRTSVDLFSVDVRTGQVYWQATVGSNQLATDHDYVFAETIQEAFFPRGITAYDLRSGDVVWKTTLALKHTVVGYLAMVQSDLIVVTYKLNAQYVLNPKNGAIKETYQTLWVERNPTYNNLVFSKEMGYKVGRVLVTQESDDSIVWTYDQPVVSNIAVSETVTYFVTKATQLIAVDTRTGDVLGVVKFTPTFPDNFDFANNHIIVAADGNNVAVYFRDKQQLSLFRFENGSP